MPSFPGKDDLRPGFLRCHRGCRAGWRFVGPFSEERDQPLDQSLADDGFGDDLALVVDQGRIGIAGRGIGVGDTVHQADLHQVTVELGLGERLPLLAGLVVLTGGPRRLARGLREPKEGITDDVVFAGVAAGSNRGSERCAPGLPGGGWSPLGSSTLCDNRESKLIRRSLQSAQYP